MEDQVTDQSGQVWDELVEVMGEIERDWWRDARGLPSADDRAVARAFALSAAMRSCPVAAM